VETREALAAALAEFSGSMLLVSHDRHLLRTTVDDFWIVADGTVQEFPGDLEDYREWLAARTAQARREDNAARREASAEAGGESLSAAERKAQRRREAEARQRLSALRKPLERELAEVEAQMQAQRERLQALDALIADPGLYEDARRDERLRVLAEHGELTKQQQALEDRWLALQEALENIG